MTDTELRDIFRSDTHKPGGEAPGVRVPWWAVLLAFAVAFLVFAGCAGLIMGRMGGAFASHGGGWSEVGLMAILLAWQFGLGIVPVFAVTRTIMARFKRGDWVFFVLIWGLGAALGFYMPVGPLAFALAGTGMIWGTLLPVPVLLTATVNYLIERMFRRAP